MGALHEQPEREYATELLPLLPAELLPHDDAALEEAKQRALTNRCTEFGELRHSQQMSRVQQVGSQQGRIEPKLPK